MTIKLNMTEREARVLLEMLREMSLKLGAQIAALEAESVAEAFSAERRTRRRRSSRRGGIPAANELKGTVMEISEPEGEV